jgi:hypothetical protein
VLQRDLYHRAPDPIADLLGAFEGGLRKQQRQLVAALAA